MVDQESTVAEPRSEASIATETPGDLNDDAPPIASPPASAAAVIKRQRSYHRNCRVCTSDKAPEVESLMAMGVQATAVSKRVGGVSADSVRRHWASHVPPDKKASLIGRQIFDKDSLTTVEKLDKEKANERDNLFLRLRAQRGLLWDLVNPQKNPDKKSQVNAHAVLLRLNELVAKILGEIQTGTNVNIDNRSVHVGASDIFEMKQIIHRALAVRFPEAYRALMEELTAPPQKEITDGR